MPNNGEDERGVATRLSDMLDSTSGEVFDRLAKLAAIALHAPIALISFFANRKQLFKSQYGLSAPEADIREIPLIHFFCGRVVASNEILLVRDSRVHPQVSLTLEPKGVDVIAFAGVPLTDSKGYPYGCLCAIDTKPREWTQNDLDILKSLSAQTLMELELRHTRQLLATDVLALQQEAKDRMDTARLTVHDLRTPLNSLVMNLEVIKDFGTLPPEQSEWLALAQRSADALTLLVGDLIDNAALEQVSKQALQIEEVPPQNLVEAAVDQVYALARAKQIAIQKKYAPSLPSVKVDFQKFLRLLVNLLGNATKFTPANGTVTVDVKMTANHKVSFSVTDTGIGFDMRLADSLFESGRKLDKETSTKFSTGWGLEFCKRIAAAHGGSIEVQSMPDIGSKFTVLLPV